MGDVRWACTGRGAPRPPLVTMVWIGVCACVLPPLPVGGGGRWASAAGDAAPSAARAPTRPAKTQARRRVVRMLIMTTSGETGRGGQPPAICGPLRAASGGQVPGSGGAGWRLPRGGPRASTTGITGGRHGPGRDGGDPPGGHASLIRTACSPRGAGQLRACSSPVAGVVGGQGGGRGDDGRLQGAGLGGQDAGEAADNVARVHDSPRWLVGCRRAVVRSGSTVGRAGGRAPRKITHRTAREKSHRNLGRALPAAGQAQASGITCRCPRLALTGWTARGIGERFACLVVICQRVRRSGRLTLEVRARAVAGRAGAGAALLPVPSAA